MFVRELDIVLKEIYILDSDVIFLSVINRVIILE